MVAVAGVALFWAGVIAAGVQLDGYSAREDYISTLAARGSPVAALAIAALSASVVAHSATAHAVLVAWRARVCSGLVLLSALAVLAVAGLRQSCRAGVAGCARGPGRQSRDWLDAAHGVAVGAYAALTICAMLALAGTVMRVGTAPPRWLGPTSVVFAAASALLLTRVGGEDAGHWQRLWVAANLAWLVTVAAAATWHTTRRGGARSGAGGRG